MIFNKLKKIAAIKNILIIFLMILWGWWTLYSTSYKFHPAVSSEPTQIIYPKDKRKIVSLKNLNSELELIGEYIITGIIISISNQEFTNETNLINLCILWGKNISLYKKGGYDCWHEQGQCVLKMSQQSKQDFVIANFSNSHILLPSDTLLKKADNLQIGDQVKITGELVNIKNLKTNEWLKSSIIRDDIGDGACEILLAKDIEILFDAYSKYHILIHIIFALAILFIALSNRLLLKFR
ncbi:MAG: hypothetical protein HRT87_05750 [Legionellales bacterium]|nr:hypothetical protein [Legionellales bacterium]